MTTERWQAVKEILGAALERPGEERHAFLTTACGGDEELRAEVTELLTLEGRLGDFLTAPIFTFRAGAEDDPNLGALVGPYRLVGRLGQGGMGAVYLGERADGQFAQQVAVKLIKRGMDSEEILARFRTERQILASLRHDHIARLFDGGTTDDGVSYFVLEYVPGEPIDRYCDARRLPTLERLRLFGRVCEAVHVAHQNLVVHRDLKPSNILVTPEGVPKLLDFGIAKLLTPEPESPASPTLLGPLPMTPSYASPEQLRGERITTASDVYALGVVLYELLTGLRPYPVDTQSPSEWLRAVTDLEPQRPSSAVRRRPRPAPADDGPTVLSAEAIARVRDGEPRRLVRRLFGDLDNIVLKAIAKEPERRYASAEQLAEDVRRYLDGLPVLARRDTLGYRAAKFVRRHPGGVAVGAAGVLVVVGFAVTMAVQRQAIARQRDRVRVERDRAEVERDRAQEVTEFLVDVFRQAEPSRARGETVTAREILDRGAEKIGRLDYQPETKATLLDAMGRVYRNLGLYDSAREMLIEALRLRRETFGPEDLRVAESLHNVADLERKLGDDAAAEGRIREALAIQRRLLAPDDLQLGKALHNLASVRAGRGAWAEAEALFREALAIKVKAPPGPNLALEPTLNGLASVRLEQGDYAEAEALFRQVLAARRSALTPPHHELANILNNLAIALAEQGKDEEAERLYAESLAMRRRLHDGPHDRVAKSLNNLGFFLQTRGRLREAEPLLREALAIDRALLGEDHHETAAVRRNLADLVAVRDGGSECEALAERALATFRRIHAPDHWRVADAESVLGGCLARRGRFAEAEPLLLGGHERLVAAPARPPYLNAARVRLVELYVAWGRPQEAARFREAGEAGT